MHRVCANQSRLSFEYLAGSIASKHGPAHIVSQGLCAAAAVGGKDGRRWHHPCIHIDAAEESRQSVPEGSPVRIPVSYPAIALSLTALGCASDPAANESFPRSIDASNQAIHAVARSNTALASKLNRALADQPGNLFYSPLSIEAVSGMLLAAAAGETAAQLATLLETADDPTTLHQGLGALLRDLTGERDTYALSVANRLWTLPGLEPRQMFVDTLRQDYAAPTESLDFARDPNAARVDINAWVSDQTNAKTQTCSSQATLLRALC